MSIKGNLVSLLVIMFLIFGFFTCLMMYNVAGIIREVSSIQTTINELDTMIKLHTAINRQIREVIFYLMSGYQPSLKHYQNAQLSIESAFKRWERATGNDRVGFERDAPWRGKIKSIEDKYSMLSGVFQEAIKTFEFGQQQEALAIVIDKIDSDIDVLLFTEIDQLIMGQVEHFTDTYSNILMGLASMPWVAQQSKQELKKARAVSHAFINIDRVQTGINRQMSELMLYLVGGEKQKKKDFRRYEVEIRASLWGWISDLQAGVDSVDKKVAGRLQDITAVVQTYNQTLDVVKQVYALKDAGDQPAVVALIEEKLEPMLNGELLAQISRASGDTKNFIAKRHRALLTFTASAASQGIVILLGFLLPILLIYLKLIRGMIISLNKLKAGTEIISMGNLDYQIDLKYRNELGELATSFNKMALDLKKSRDDIVAAKDYTENILRSMNDSLIVVSPDGSIRNVNTTTCIMLGYREDELVGEPFKKIVRPEQVSFVMSWLDNLVIARFIRNIEEVYVAKDGREIPVLFAGSLLVDKHGQILGIVCVAQDITERKEAEASLVRAKDELEIKVVIRTEELQRTNKQLQHELAERKKTEEELMQAYTEVQRTQRELVQTEKISALGRFSIGIAHEVKNPLGIILGGIEFIEAKLGVLDPVVVSAVEKIKDAIFRADTIVGNLLKFARPSELKIENIRVTDLIEEALALYTYHTPHVNIAIQTEFPQQDLFIAVDRNHLQQVVFNLMNNAIEATSAGGTITVRAYASDSPLDPREKRHCIITITDNGEGIAKDNMPKIFEPFFTTKRDRRGTGLGLSISKTILNNHAGDLELESQPGVGTTAKIILPLSE